MHASTKTARLESFDEIFRGTVHDDTRHALFHALHGRVALIIMHSRVDLISQINRLDAEAVDEIEDALTRHDLKLRPTEMTPPAFADWFYRGAHLAPAEYLLLECGRISVRLGNNVAVRALLERNPHLTIDDLLTDVSTVKGLMQKAQPSWGQLVNEQAAAKIVEQARYWVGL